MPTMVLCRGLNASITTASISIEHFVLTLDLNGNYLEYKDFLIATTAYTAVFVMFLCLDGTCCLKRVANLRKLFIIKALSIK
jgi:hypothetical protein